MQERKILLKMLHKYGYAPGSYYGKCGLCNQVHIADKRAVVCVHCAVLRVLNRKEKE
jgi:hypothetical protein